MIRAIAPVATLLLGVAILLTGQGLQGVLMPVRATMEQFSTFSVGFIGGVYFLGFTYGCWRGPRLIRRAGHVRVFAAMTAVASASPLLAGLWVDVWSWAALRFVTGYCFAVLYIVIESWLNERATDENRGVVFSAYIFINMTVLALGQQMLLLDDPASLHLFALVSVLVSLAAVPLLMSTREEPCPIEDARFDLRVLYKNSPTGMLGCLTSGLANGSFWALAPVFVAAYIQDVSISAWFMTAVVLGGAAGQWPLGWLSDRLDRRYVLGSICLGALGVAVAMWLLAPVLPVIGIILLGGAWGALAFPVYSIAVAQANDRASSENYVMISSGLLLMYGIGAITGPLIASGLMTVLGGGGLFLFTGAIHTLLGLYVLLRRRQRVSVEPKRQTGFSDALAATHTASHVYEEELEAEGKARGKP
jgi:MFS family permease